ESDVSTNVFEFTDGQFGVSQASALINGTPFQDSYQVALTKDPGAETITITVQAEPTRTSQTGGIFAFSPQLKVCVGAACETAAMGSFDTRKTVTFTHADWNTPKTIWVRAIDDTRVDGQDTQVFAPMLNQLNNIQGPLFINGGSGADRTGLLARRPVMLAGGADQQTPQGTGISSSPGGPHGGDAPTVPTRTAP